MAADGKERIRQLTEEVERKHRIYEEQRLKRRRGLMRRLSVFAAVILLFTGFAGFTIYQQSEQMAEQEAEIARLEVQQQELKSEELRLESEIESLQDPEYIAEIARRDFFLTKPGETLFQIPEHQETGD
ncbi:FtsB family cell division protein [Salisediminibacterium beveridgei]|uniref:Cell division protein DivIC n=1 Tax=Salisediminibacterium beveridgei TaxID=632773 RepID=A0A1D7R034_9BACI|nr:septum formation initiator family protein [Salisediminibacterium beveridgei]AOM84615.1 Cell division protein DivIC [Salisediminibacterium beveridgei]